MKTFLFSLLSFVTIVVRSSQGNSNDKVIIIGGGASGLSAAKRLKENGVPVVLLEGRNRLGGRIRTEEVTDAQSSTVDLGAAWIDGAPSNYVYQVAVEAGLETVSQEYITAALRIYDDNNGVGWMPWYRTVLVMGRIAVALTRFYWMEYPEGTSLEEALEFWDTSSSSRKLFDALIEIGAASQLDKIGANMVKNATLYAGSSVMIYGGYGKLIEYLSEALTDDEIILNKTVTNITVFTSESGSNSSVVVGTNDGQSYTGSHVIVTVPLGVLKSDMITFDPPLPQEKLDAINRTGWGVVEKIVLTFKNVFWRRLPNTHSNLIYLHYPHRFPIFIDITETAGSPTISALLTVKTAAELTLNPNKLIEEVKDILRTMFPDDYEDPVAATNSSWLPDPFSRGSYMVEGPDFLVGDIDLIAAPAHNERVLFAGDSTHDQFRGYVGGAMLSGLREADRVIEAKS